MQIEELKPLPNRERKVLLERRAQERRARQAMMGERRRELLLDVATDALTESGWDGFNLRDMAAKAGYSAAALYAYFDSKEQLLACVRDRWLQTLLGAVEQARLPRSRTQVKVDGAPWQPLYAARMQTWWSAVARHPAASHLMFLPWQPTTLVGASTGLMSAMERVTAAAQDGLEQGWGDGVAARRAHGDILAVGLGYLLALGSTSEPTLTQAMEARFLDAMSVRLQAGGRVSAAADDADVQADLFLAGPQ